MAFVDIPDARVAAYKPLIGKILAKRMRNNLVAGAVRPLHPGVFGSDLTGSTTNTTWTTVATLQLFIPSSFIPMDISLELFVESQESGAGTGADFRVQIGGDQSAEVNLSGTPGGGDETSLSVFSLTGISPTSNAVNAVELQAKRVTGDGAVMTWRSTATPNNMSEMKKS